MTLYSSLRLYKALISAFLLNLMTTHLYSSAANTGAILTERRDCTDGGSSTAAATFAQL